MISQWRCGSMALWIKVSLLVGCLTSQQQASVSQGRICSDNGMCCHTGIEVADQTFYLTQSQYTHTWPTSPSADPPTPGDWQGSPLGYRCLSHWYDSTGKMPHGHSGVRTQISRSRGWRFTTRLGRQSGRPVSRYLYPHRLEGPVVKASASRAEDPGFESRLRWDFSGVESYQWLQNWHCSGYPARRLAW